MHVLADTHVSGINYFICLGPGFLHKTNASLLYSAYRQSDSMCTGTANTNKNKHIYLFLSHCYVYTYLYQVTR